MCRNKDQITSFYFLLYFALKYDILLKAKPKTLNIFELFFLNNIN